MLEGDPAPPPRLPLPGQRYLLPATEAEPAVPATEEEEALWEADYGLGRLWLAARDPHTLHASWDLTPAQAVAAGERLALRVFAGREPVGAFREVALSPVVHSVFVPAEQAGQWYVATLGFRDAAGRWQELAQSAPVRTPTLVSLEARPEEFVMLTLPAEVEATAPPGFVEPSVTGRPSEPELLPPAPVGIPAIPSPEPPTPAPRPPAPSVPPAPSMPVGEAFPPLPPAPPEPEPREFFPPAPAKPATSPVPAARPVTAAPGAVPRLVPAPAPPWTPAQAREMAAAVAALVPTAGPSSAELAAAPPAGAAPERPVPAAPGSPAAPFGREVRAAEVPSSGALPAPAAARRFWFNINAEVIVYGATEPDATVTVDGQPVALRPDGSFTLRFALPDGEYELEAVATAADGAEQRLARLKFARRTHYRGEVGPHPSGLVNPPRAATG